MVVVLGCLVLTYFSVGSDEHAAVYYLARMLEAGEDPLKIARRIVRMASEVINRRGFCEGGLHTPVRTRAAVEEVLTDGDSEPIMRTRRKIHLPVNTSFVPVPHACSVDRALSLSAGVHTAVFLYSLVRNSLCVWSPISVFTCRQVGARFVVLRSTPQTFPVKLFSHSAW